MGIVIEGVGLITGFDDTGKSVDSHIHQAELGVVFHLFLTIEGHGAVCIHACMIDKITGLDILTSDLGVKNTPSSWAMFFANLLRKYS